MAVDHVNGDTQTLHKLNKWINKVHLEEMHPRVRVRELWVWEERHCCATFCWCHLDRLLSSSGFSCRQTCFPLLCRTHESCLAQGRVHSVCSGTILLSLTSSFQLALGIQKGDVHKGQGTLDISETHRPGAMRLVSISRLKLVDSSPQWETLTFLFEYQAQGPLYSDNFCWLTRSTPLLKPLYDS